MFSRILILLVLPTLISSYLPLASLHPFNSNLRVAKYPSFSSPATPRFTFLKAIEEPKIDDKIGVVKGLENTAAASAGAFF